MVKADALTLPALDYIAACATDNDVQQLGEIGVTEDQAKALERIDGLGRRRLAAKAITKRCLITTIDVLLLHRLIEYLNQCHRRPGQPSKEGLFTLAVLQHVQACMASEDVHSLRELNLVYRDVQAIQDLRLGESYGYTTRLLLSAHSRCVAIRVNQALLAVAIKTLEEELTQQEQIFGAIAGGATKTMMRELVGMSSREYSDYRMFLGLSPRPGRLKQPDRRAIDLLYRHFKQLRADHVSFPLRLPEYQSISEITRAPLGVIWKLFKAWDRVPFHRSPPRACDNGMRR